MHSFKFRHARGLGGLLAGLGALVTMLVVTGTSAMAMIPASGGGDGVSQPLPPPPVIGGMPGWQITLIAVGAALVAASLAVLADRARSARRRQIAGPAARNVPVHVSEAR
jgi:hypothetical protein